MTDRKDSRVGICLIGGTGRSGTTIFKQIFQGHPLVARVPECRFSTDPDGLVDFYSTFSTNWSPYLYHTHIRRLKKMLHSIGSGHPLLRTYAFLMQKTKLERHSPFCLIPRYAGLQVKKICPGFREMVDKLIEELVMFQYSGQWNGSHLLERNRLSFAYQLHPDKLAEILGSFWRGFIEKTCGVQQKNYYVEDNTWNILFFHKIIRLLPDAKLIHIHREPRDVIASYIQMRWAPKDPAQAAHWYRSIMERWFHIRESLDPDRFMEIALEELVKHPRECLERACQFWNIPWDDSLLETDLSKSHSGRWKKDFDTSQIKAIDAVLSGLSPVQSKC